MTFDFSIAEWSGCAPGLVSQADWLAWARQPHIPSGDDLAPLREMPPLLRRRLSGVGRLAAQAAYQCPEAVPGSPLVFASRYGDAAKSLELISGFARRGEVSPADFALSVHNAIGAVYSIARRDASNYISVAGGAGSAAAGIVEAAGLLADGAPEVTVVCYDAALPAPYERFQNEAFASYAWVWRIVKPAAGRPCLRLSTGPCDASAQHAVPMLPFGLDVMRFALSTDARLQRVADGVAWTWSRHG